MFRFTGILFVFISSLFIFNRNNFTDFITYKFLRETVKLIDVFIPECSKGMTYPKIFETLDYTQYIFFEKDGLAMYPLIKRSFINRQQLNAVKIFFEGLGKRNLEEEIDYLKENKHRFTQEAEIYKTNYKKCLQADMLYGISAAVITIIVFI